MGNVNEGPGMLGKDKKGRNSRWCEGIERECRRREKDERYVKKRFKKHWKM